MEIEAPTFNSLNKPQKRALILRDQLRWTDARHLDGFIEGLTDDEPPTYRRINGATQPPLRLVTLKSSATRFDLGNVLFPEENNAIHRVYLTVEDGRFEMHTEEGLPQDDANLQSVPIHGFIARTMVPMFKDKFQAIFARQTKINEARRAAFNTPVQPPTHFHEGQTLARLDPIKTQQNGETALTKRPKKRKPGDAVIKHPCNKRTRTGLESIPDTMKSAAFNTIAEHIKVDLFNTFSKTAFPHFDNLMMASWNVVSVYSAVGTDFPELHKAIVELKHVLVDFDEAFGQKIDRTDVRYRADFDPAKRTGKDEPRALLPPSTLNARQESGLVNGKSLVSGVGEQQGAEDIEAGGSEQQNLTTQHSMLPPRPLQPSPYPNDEEKSEEESFEDLITPGPPTKDKRRADSSRSTLRSRPETSNTALVDSTHSSPASRSHAKKPNDQHGESSTTSSPSSDTTNPELARRREEYASSISKTNKHISAAAAATARESSEPTPAPKTKKTLADLTTVQLHQKYRDRKQNLVKLHGSIANSPSLQRDIMRQIEDMMKLREREEAEAGAGADECFNPYAGRHQRKKSLTSQTPRDVDDASAGAVEPARPRGGSLAPFGASGSPRRAPIPGVGMAGSYLEGSNLGKSMLGAKKQMGSAPVAPMMATRKDMDGDSKGNGNGYDNGGGNGYGISGGHGNGNGSGNRDRGGEARRGPRGSHEGF